MFKETIKLFNVVVSNTTIDTVHFDNAEAGFVTNFIPTIEQLTAMKEIFVPLMVKTLFSLQERKNMSANDLIAKQILHYIEVYGLNSPGLFNLEHEDGIAFTITYVKGVSRNELQKMVLDLLYKNAPVKDAVLVKAIIDEYEIKYDINKIANNELRVMLFNVKNDVFESGDDVVRWLCFNATQSPMLIKSKIVIDAVGKSEVSNAFLDVHTKQLAAVFNRHKKLIMALKNVRRGGLINKISRLSKSLHIPIQESLSKRFVSEALHGRISKWSVLDQMTVRDKFKFLNLLEYKKAQKTTDAFVIRNGKVHIEHDREVFDIDNVTRVQDAVLKSLVKNFKHLKGKSILLDKHVDYGLPSSRKQALGNLPFGTTITTPSKEISSGIYWKDNWGARDLDLSTVDMYGNSVGWGRASGYSDGGIVFSGDVTSAPNGAMEFMTSGKSCSQEYGIFVNIFSGEIGCKMALVIGNRGKNHWIDECIVKEEYKLDSRGCILGFIRDGKFIVFGARINSKRASFNQSGSVVNRAQADFWTVKKLFDATGIKYDTSRDDGVEYVHDLSYKSFSYDVLEKVFMV